MEENPNEAAKPAGINQRFQTASMHIRPSETAFPIAYRKRPSETL
ncbi:hypothetical protein [Neisseria elongata]|nr:hypothetical protein [Neisseria elongata]